MTTVLYLTAGISIAGCVLLFLSLVEKRKLLEGAISQIDKAQKVAISYQELAKQFERQVQMAAATDADQRREIARLNDEVNHWQQQYSVQLHRVEELEGGGQSG